MIAAIVLALQLSFGIANPTPDQINTLGPVMYSSYQPIGGGGTNGVPIDPSELSVYKAAHPTN